MDSHYSQRKLLSHQSIGESIELSSTNTQTSSLQMRSHRRTPRRTNNKTTNNRKDNKNKQNNNSSSTSLMFCSYISWSLISFISSIILFFGFWAPYWIEGIYIDNIHASFGPFKRCNYPLFNSSTGPLKIISNCSKYDNFSSIPSIPWKISTILSSISLVLIFFVSFILLVSCCWKLSPKNAKSIVKFQFLSILTLLLACLAFPFGMSTREVFIVCGSIQLPFDFGNCQISYSIYLFISSILTTFLSMFFGVFSVKILEIRENRAGQFEEFV